jgi:hypothetical protein
MTGEAAFREAAAERRVRSVPLSHLSIEVGHAYFDDLRGGTQRLRALFAGLRPWVDAATDIRVRALGRRTPRVSTCFLIDDYFSPGTSPAKVVPDLLDAADAAGVRIDYLARESGCAVGDGIPLASMVQERIVADPPPATTGARPPVTLTGWLCNGQRAPTMRAPVAMETASGWQPPVQNAANRHSVFVDVELWNETPTGRVWSCAFLASVWQLLRLGMLRYRGAAVATPGSWDGPWPDHWDDLPAVLKVNPGAAPFTAYRSLSVLPKRFMTTEYAVRTILDQVFVDSDLVDDVVERGRREELDLSREANARMDYIFVD